MKLQHITFTGIDKYTNIERLQAIQKKYPIAEFGVLTSYHWYENGNRYLDPKFINNLRGNGLNLALHICGSAAHDVAIGHWNELLKLIGEDNLKLFKRYQLNIANRSDNPSYVCNPYLNWQEVIIQQKNIENTDIYKSSLKTFPYYKNYSMLLDASGGQGINAPLRIYHTNRKIGYAGGINADNVAEKLTFLMENEGVGDFWIDMESGVRTDDWFDLDKVVKVLEIYSDVLKQYE